MPTRTELVITLGEVLDCLPPGKAYKRRRYNSFDANIGPVEGNEENQAPATLHMRTEGRVEESVRAKRAASTLTCDETDDEISFRDIKLNGDSPDDGKNKSKRKSNAERFLEDNANYFQLEVLTSKTRSNKLVTDGSEGDSDGDGKGGFHTSFLDFLKSKGVEKDAPGRSRHKSADSDVGERASSRTAHGRSRSSHSRFGRSRSSARERSLSRGRGRLLPGVDGSEVFMSESESECSVRTSRVEAGGEDDRSLSPEESPGRPRVGRARGRQGGPELARAKSSARETSPSGSEAEIVIRPRRGKSAVRGGSVTESEVESPLPSLPFKRRKSQMRDFSPSESEAEAPTTRSRRGKSRDVSPSESETEVPSTRSRRGKSRDVSPSESEAEAPTTRSRRGKNQEREVSPSESESEAPTTRSRRGKSRDASPSESEADVPSTKSRRGKSRDVSPSESEADAPSTRSRRGKSREVSPSESEAEAPTTRSRRGKSRDLSPSESEADIPSTRSRRGKSREVSPSESEAEAPTTRSRRGKSRDVSPSESEAEVSSSRTRRGKSRDLSPSESEAEAPTTRSRRGKSPPQDDASESEVDTPIRTRRSKSSARDVRDISLSESEAETPQPRTRHSRSSAREVSPSGSEAELPGRTRRGARKECVSPSGSEASLASSSYKQKVDKVEARESDAESDDEAGKQVASSGKKEKESPQSKKNKQKKKRSELDKLLEAVDTSFHFETAAAERKRMTDSGLGPLEIDCSDTGSEASCNISNKRKFSEMTVESNKKKCKESNNLLKTASPGSALKSEDFSGDDFESASGHAWDGWDSLNSQLELITEDPVEVNKMHFSFETEPVKESWYCTYQRQDRGDELVFYPTSNTAPFLLPYEMPYVTFQPTKAGRRDTDTSRDQSKASSPVRQLGGLGGKKGRRISECESTDSEEARRGKGRASKASSTTSSMVAEKLGPKAALLLESNYRVSPRCHASTKSLGLSGGLPGDLDDLAEAYLMQDERELHFPHLLPFLPSEDNSNDSFSSGSVNSRVRSENSVEMSKLAESLDSLMQNPGDLPCTPLSPSTPAKVPPTRSRVSSDQLLSPKKAKKKKKLPAESEQGGVSPLDQLVADNVDPVLLDCLEDELPTVPCPPLEDPLDMLETYSTCTSMSVCNSRWLRPNKRDSLLSSSKQKEVRLENKPKKLPSPNKPKRIIIYKDDLPGFSIDSDMEAEKLPVSKRGKARQTDTNKQEEEEEKVKSPPKKDSKKAVPKKGEKKEDTKKLPEKKVDKSDDVDAILESDDDSESVESFCSTSSGSKKRRRTNKTGFPSPKKKKKPDASKNSPLSQKSSPINQSKSTKSKPDQKALSKSASKPEKPKQGLDKPKQGSEEAKATPKKNVSKQLKMDRFITKKTAKKPPISDKSKPSPSPVVPLVPGRRSVALKAKNYSELESDTESLFESSLLASPSPSPAPGPKKAKSSSVQSKGVKKR